jgi:hypothetical protein
MINKQEKQMLKVDAQVDQEWERAKDWLKTASANKYGIEVLMLLVDTFNAPDHGLSFLRLIEHEPDLLVVVRSLARLAFSEANARVLERRKS